MSLILSGTTGISGVDGSAATPALQGNDSNTGVSFGTDTVTINTGGQARVTTDASGNVGVGTVSPAAKLDVRGNAYFAGNATSRQTAQFANTGGEMFLGLEASSGGAVFVGSSAYASIIGSNNATPLQFGTNGTIRATLDSSGNLGLGVTPSAWNASYKPVELGRVGNAIMGGVAGSSMEMMTNVFLNTGGSYRYANNGAATDYYQNAGAHIWYNAPSGTAGNAISFTQAMTLNASGQLGIGFTSPDQPLAFADSLGTKIQFNGANSNGYQVGLASAVASGDAMMKFTAGEVGAGEFGFYNTTNLRMLIDTSGNLLVGTLSIPTTSNGFGVYNFGTIVTGRSTTSTAGHHEFRNPNGLVGQIVTDGSSTTYSTSSDYRLKENVAPMTGALATVAQLKPVTYTWKADGSSGQGFIAHELQAVVPDCVTGTKDAVDAEGKPQYQGVDTSFLVATLVSAIQEQQAIITQLQADVAALKGAA